MNTPHLFELSPKGKYTNRVAAGFEWVAEGDGLPDLKWSGLHVDYDPAHADALLATLPEDVRDGAAQAFAFGKDARGYALEARSYTLVKTHAFASHDPDAPKRFYVALHAHNVTRAVDVPRTFGKLKALAKSGFGLGVYFRNGDAVCKVEWDRFA